MKKIFLGFIIVLTFLLSINYAYAEEENFGRQIRNTIRNTVQEGENEGSSPSQIKEEVRENVREEIKEHKENILDKVKNFIKKNLRFEARITGVIDTLGTSSLTVKGDDGKTYTVNVTTQTKYLRKFGGNGEFSELQVGDKVNVIGKFTDSTNLVIEAKVIRDLSIQKRWGVFFGEITTKNSDNFVMKTISRGDQTVFVTSSTKIIEHDKTAITLSDLKVGDRVRVKGVWDKTKNEIRETDEIRVFPVAPTKIPSPTP